MRSRGFTLIELLIALAIAGLVYALLFSAVINTGRYSNDQLKRGQAQEDLRLFFLRLNEIGASAAYIYPEAQTLKVKIPGTTRELTISTNRRALALLVPWGTTYCQGDNAYRGKYCAFIYFWDRRDRPPYRGVLAKNPSASDHVLVELKVTWIDWPINSLPPKDFTAYQGEVGIVIDSYDKGHSDLTNDLRLALNDGEDTELYKEGDTMDNGLTCTINNECHKHERALIRAVRPRVAVLTRPGTYVQRSEWIIPKLIPRTAEPGVAQ